MFVSTDSYDSAFAALKEDALDSDCTVLLFVAADADALCASWILTSLLKSDFIKFRMVPVDSFDDLIAAKDELKRSPGTIKSIVLLNAGATADVLEIFDAEDTPDNVLRHLKFYIIDSHRPVHLANCFDDSRVFVFDDGMTQESVPPPADVLDSDSDGEDGNGDDTADDADDAADADDDDDKNNEIDFPDDDDDDAGAPKAKRQQKQKQRRRRRRKVGEGWVDEAREDRRRARRLVQDQYYGQTSYGPAVATLVWHLAGDLNRTSNHLLWLAIVGLTEQFLHEKIDADTYAESVAILGDDVRRLNVDSDAPEDREAVNRLHITREAELRFMLLRHWTLFEAMVHSQYVASRLGVWRGKGKDRLKDLLARMGFSLEQCQQKYTNMDVRVRRTLLDQITKCAPEFGLDSCVMDSFVAQTGYTSKVSATDVVYAISALLEAPLGDGGWQANFFKAFDALALTGQALLNEGMALAMKQHIGLLRLVESIVDGKNGLRKTQNFRYAIVEGNVDGQNFLHPIALTKLAHFLLDTYRYNADSQKKTRPLVVAALKPASETYIVVGVWVKGPRADGAVVPNEFGRHFQVAGERIHARLRMTSFDSSVMEIKRDDMPLFISSLQQHLARY